MSRYSAWSVFAQGLRGNKGWRRAWRDPTPKPSYDVIIVGGGGHGLATAYYLAKEHGVRNVAVVEKGWLGGGNTGRNTTIVRSNYMIDGNTRFYERSVNLRELLARIKSVLRRAAAGRTGDQPIDRPLPQEDRLPFGHCWLNLASRQLYDEDGQEISTTAMEFDLLKAFVERPNRVLSRDFLLDIAHNREREAFDRSIDIRIARLRRKVELDPGKPQVIKTVRGAGYMFVTKEGLAAG